MVIYQQIEQIQIFVFQKVFLPKKKQVVGSKFFSVLMKKIALKFEFECFKIVIFISQKRRGHPIVILAKSWKMVIYHQIEQIPILLFQIVFLQKKTQVVGVDFFLVSMK